MADAGAVLRLFSQADPAGTSCSASDPKPLAPLAVNFDESRQSVRHSRPTVWDGSERFQRMVFVVLAGEKLP